MKNLTCIILFITLTNYYSQQVLYKGNKVDSIFIKSDLSVYQFDKKGSAKGKFDVLSIFYYKKKKKYIIDRSNTNSYLRTFKPDTFQIKTRSRKKDIGLIVKNFNIINLLTALSTNIESKNLIHHLDTNELKKILTEKQVRKMAKRHGVYWHFRKRYSTKSENEQFFKQCLSIDSLQSYLITNFKSLGYPMITDYSNTINIWISTNQKEYRFEGKYPNHIKQPWFNHSDTTSLLPNSILNLSINNSLLYILPKDFLLKESITNKALIDNYIVWYFEKRGMIY